MQWRSTIGVLVLAALLAAAFWIGRQAGWATRGGAGGSQRELVRLIEGGELTSIEARRAPADPSRDVPPATVYRRTSEGWIQEAPVWYPLRPEAAAELLGLLEGAVGSSVRDAVPAELALDPGIVQLTVQSSAGQEEVRLGEERLDGGGYAWSPSAGTVLLNGALHRLFLHTEPEALRRRTLPVPPAAALAAVSVADARAAFRSFVLRREAWGWVVDEQGAVCLADQEAVRQVLDQAVSPIVVRFIEPRESLNDIEQTRAAEGSRRRGRDGSTRRSFGLEVDDPGRIVLAFSTDPLMQRNLVRVVLGRGADLAGETRFARVNDASGQESPVLQVRQPPLSPLLAGDPSLFRLRQILPAELTEVRSVEVVRGTERVKHEVGPGRGVPAWLAELLTAEAASFLPGFRLDDPPQYRLLIDWGLTSTTHASVYRWDGNLVLLRDGESVGLVFPAGVLEAALDANLRGD